MSEIYRRPTIAKWLLPSAIGPMVASWLAALLYALLGVRDELFWVVLVTGVAIGSLWAFAYAIVAALLDVALLGIKVRRLPNGRDAWLQSFAAPALSLAAYAVYPPHKWWKLGPWAVVVAVLVPPVIAIVASRLAIGKKP